VLLLYLGETSNRLCLILDIILSKFEINFDFGQDLFRLLVAFCCYFNLLICGQFVFFEFGF